MTASTLTADQLEHVATALGLMDHCDRCGKRMGQREGRNIRGRVLCKRCRLDLA